MINLDSHWDFKVFKEYRGNKNNSSVREEFLREHHLEKSYGGSGRGHVEPKNLEALVANGYHFIVGSRLTKIPTIFPISKTGIFNLTTKLLTTQEG